MIRKPTYERQNQFISDYIYPLFCLDFGRIIENYKASNMAKGLEPVLSADRLELRADMKRAGVFKSLEKLEALAISGDQVERLNEMILAADPFQEYGIKDIQTIYDVPRSGKIMNRKNIDFEEGYKPAGSA